jgi:hypothetical protein
MYTSRSRARSLRNYWSYRRRNQGYDAMLWVSRNEELKRRHPVSFKSSITTRELAEFLGLKPYRLIVDLMSSDVFAGLDSPIDDRVVKRIAAQHGYAASFESADSH